MASQVFFPASYMVSPIDLISDNDEDTEEDVRWRHDCHVTAQVDQGRVRAYVLSDLDADDSPLYELIDDAIATSHEPGRPKANVPLIQMRTEVPPMSPANDRDAELVRLRDALQCCESRQRLVLTALEELRQRVVTMAMDVTSVAGAAEIIAALGQISRMLAEEVRP